MGASIDLALRATASRSHSCDPDHGSMGPTRGIDGVRMGVSPQGSHSECPEADGTEKTDHMEAVRLRCGQQRQDTGRNGEATDLDVLGPEPSRSALSSPVEAIRAFEKLLRIKETCLVLNSTPLGQVLSERQLMRHRVRAEHRFSVGKKVNLLKYVAWLVQERHEPTSRRAANARPISSRDILALLREQDYRCALTGRELSPSTAALDHIIPVSRCGEHVLTNVQILDKTVNRAKNTCTNEEFVDLCREVVRWADRKSSSEPWR